MRSSGATGVRHPFAWQRCSLTGRRLLHEPRDHLVSLVALLEQPCNVPTLILVEFLQEFDLLLIVRAVIAVSLIAGILCGTARTRQCTAPRSIRVAFALCAFPTSQSCVGDRP